MNPKISPFFQRIYGLSDGSGFHIIAADNESYQPDRNSVRDGSLMRELGAPDPDLQLRLVLNEVPPGFVDTANSSATGGHARKIVQEMVDFVQRNYQRPLHMEAVAAELKMNAAYLCSLFSRTSGVTFHHYLDLYRLAKSKELLRDPRNRVREVATAVGYSSADYFRHSFKAKTGHSPTSWRGRL